LKNTHGVHQKVSQKENLLLKVKYNFILFLLISEI
jgi:hypothetical protein